MNDHTPRISIVTPNRNGAQFLQATLDSVTSQQYQNVEHIVIDGQSTDGSCDILDRYAHRLAYVSSGPDNGQYDAINKGFAHATGDILCWLNSDDLFFPWTLRTVASIFTQLPEVEWITTLQPGFWDAGGFCLGFETMRGFARDAFLQGCYLPGGKPFLGYIQQESTFWRRSLWERAGTSLRTQFSLAADFDLWARFYEHADLYGVACPLAGFRFSAGQRSLDAATYQREAAAALAESRRRMRWRNAPFAQFSGRRITRRDRNSPNGAWTVEPCTFE